MNLLDLPPDLLLSIADFTPEPSLNALLQTTSTLYALLNLHLYRKNVRCSRSSALLWASLYGNAAVVRRLLSQNANVNTTAVRRRRRTGGHLPAPVIEGGPSMMVQALEHEVKKGYSYGGPPSPLLYAAAGGYVDVMTVLIAHGAEVHDCYHTTTTTTTTTSSVKKCCHRTPLMMAADRGHIAALEILLAHSADINAPQAKCNSPLSLAAVNGHVAAVQMLLRHGADVNMIRRGGTSLIKAVRAGRLEVVRILLDEGSADLTISDDRGFTALFWAVRENYVEIISLLLRFNPDQIERRDSIGRTPLALAAWEERVEAIECLLAHGAHVNATNRVGQTPLWWAVLTDSTAATTSLLRHGADTEIMAPLDSEVMPVLLAAMLRFHYSVVEVLLDHGADPNCQSSSDSGPGSRSGSGRNTGRGWKKTPLWLAAKEREPSLARKLLHHGADPNTRAGPGDSSPLCWAITAGHICIATMLLDHGADANALVRRTGKTRSPLCHAMRHRQYAIARCLVDHGADPNEPGWDGGPLLVKATARENMGLTRAMLEHGACPNVKDKYGKSPLFLASVKRNHALERMLLAHGADPALV